MLTIRPFQRRAILWVALPASLGWVGCGADPHAGLEAAFPEPGAPEVLWDVWGVPHIFAASDEDLFYAHGWAVLPVVPADVLTHTLRVRGEANLGRKETLRSEARPGSL